VGAHQRSEEKRPNTHIPYNQLKETEGSKREKKKKSKTTARNGKDPEGKCTGNMTRRTFAGRGTFKTGGAPEKQTHNKGDNEVAHRLEKKGGKKKKRLVRRPKASRKGGARRRTWSDRGDVVGQRHWGKPPGLRVKT